MKKILSIIIILLVLIGGYYAISSWNNKQIEKKEDLMHPSFMDKVEPDTAETLIEGKWQSIQDPSFVREFTKTAVSDFYDNELITDIGSWQIFSSEEVVPGFPGEAEEDQTYVVLRFENEVLFFKIVEVTKKSLDMVYLNRGGVLSFTRIPELE